LEREGDAGGHQTDAGGEACRVVEPDGAEADDGQKEGREADALAGPEGGLLAVSAELAREKAKDPGERVEEGEENQREEKLVAGVGVQAEELDAAKRKRAVGAGELHERAGHEGWDAEVRRRGEGLQYIAASPSSVGERVSSAAGGFSGCGFAPAGGGSATAAAAGALR